MSVVIGATLLDDLTLLHRQRIWHTLRALESSTVILEMKGTCRSGGCSAEG